MASALAGVAVVGALLAIFVSWDRGNGETASAPSKSSAPIDARAALSPQIVLFGDTVRARVDVTVDTTRIDPGTVRVAGDFSPWEVIGKPERVDRDGGTRAFVRTTFVLRCLSGSCVPSGQSAPLEFNDVRVGFGPPGAEPGDLKIMRVAWPVLLVYSRFAAANLEDLDAATAPWHADLLSLPAVSYRLAPGLLVALLLSGAALAVLAAAWLTFVTWPRPVPEPLPEPEPELPPEPILSPLEQALALLEESVRSDGAADQRRALELVAEELELSEWGDPDLARAARALAWSEDVPPVDETTGLAERVRSALPVIYEPSENGDGHVV